MKTEELPGIYLSADAGAKKFQKNYLTVIKLEYFSLAGLAVLSELREAHTAIIPLMSVALVLLFGLLIFRFVSKLDRKWYACRALAESLKTNSWKFVMRAHPFENSSSLSLAVRNFSNSIIEIQRDNRFLGVELDPSHSDSDQITEKMFELRKLSVPERLEHYIKYRVKQQRCWYAKRAKWNAVRRSFWFWFAIFMYFLVTLCLFSNQLFGSDLSWAFGFLLLIVTSSFAWIQVKRHGELAASYTLTAHEIGSIQTRSQEVIDEDTLSTFVNSAELAFSREHTQWAARRDFA